MKKKYLLIEFLIILLFLIIPPILVGKNESEGAIIAAGGTFSLQILFQAIVALFLHFQFSLVIAPNSDFDASDDKKERAKRFFLGLAWWAITLGLLMISEAAFTAVSILFKIEGSNIGSIPKDAVSRSIFFANLIVGACYEEVVYREFLPETLSKLIEKKKFEIPLELICVALFALAHRYLGIVAVLNAFVCGIILRLCYKKSMGIWTGIYAHLAYNTIQVLFMILG